MNVIHHTIQEYLTGFGLPEVEFSTPPNPKMGDLAFPCFALAKKAGKNPVEMATEIVESIQNNPLALIASAQTAGPYVNLFLADAEVAKLVLNAVSSEYGKHEFGDQEKTVVEFACPNPLKAFHLGHLKNLITGEAVVRVLENAGYAVIRVNYQGDVGMHVAKALWGIYDWKDQFDALEAKPLKERVEFLGKAYAHGAQHFEAGEEQKQEVIAYNDKVYERDPSIQDVYTQARAWSLEYFEEIYKKMGSRFDNYFFESETYERGIELVNEYTQKGIFEVGDGGAIIFPGEKHGLHNRVFINSKGFPTYEAKELALAEKHFAQFSPEKIIHVVGKEQTEYFKVVITAIEQMWPEKKGIEKHLPGGFLQIKGDQKMSSRKGNIITEDQLIGQVREQVVEIMKEQEGFDPAQEETIKKIDAITAAALKYAMLKADVTKDVAFDLEESVSTSGDSGPYLLYVVARIKSILNKTGDSSVEPPSELPEALETSEKQLLRLLAQYPEKTRLAAESLDPSVISRYLFELAQQFNSFYAQCPVLQDDASLQSFRLALIDQVAQVLEAGLNLLGIQVVEGM